MASSLLLTKDSVSGAILGFSACSKEWVHQTSGTIFGVTFLMKVSIVNRIINQPLTCLNLFFLFTTFDKLNIVK